MLFLIKQTETICDTPITSYGDSCRSQQVFSVISPKVIGRMGQNLVYVSFSIDPSCVPNYIKMRRSCHFHFDLVWNDPSLIFKI